MKKITHTLFALVAIGFASFAVFTVFTPKAEAQFTTGTNGFGVMPLCEIARDLAVGSTGEDVKCLQRYLNWAGYTLASSGAGAPGLETMYYGARTSSAVARWQNTHAASVLSPQGLSAGNGAWNTWSFNRYVGLVQAYLNLQG